MQLLEYWQGFLQSLAGRNKTFEAACVLISEVNKGAWQYQQMIRTGMVSLLTMYMKFCSLATLSPTVCGSNSVYSIISQANVRDV